MKSKKPFNKAKLTKLALSYLLTNDNDDNRYDEMMDRWREIDQDPRYDVYREDPRYNDVFTPSNYWEEHPNESENTYEKEVTYEDNNEEKTIKDNQYDPEIIENKEVNKPNENTPANTPNEKTPITLETNKSSHTDNDNNSSSNDSALGIFGIICIAVVLSIALLAFAPWLLLIVIPIILCAIFPKKRF